MGCAPSCFGSRDAAGARSGDGKGFDFAPRQVPGAAFQTPEGVVQRCVEYTASRSRRHGTQPVGPDAPGARASSPRPPVNPAPKARHRRGSPHTSTLGHSLTRSRTRAHDKPLPPSSLYPSPLPFPFPRALVDAPPLQSKIRYPTQQEQQQRAVPRRRQRAGRRGARGGQGARLQHPQRARGQVLTSYNEYFPSSPIISFEISKKGHETGELKAKDKRLTWYQGR